MLSFMAKQYDKSQITDLSICQNVYISSIRKALRGELCSSSAGF